MKSVTKYTIYGYRGINNGWQATEKKRNQLPIEKDLPKPHLLIERKACKLQLPYYQKISTKLHFIVDVVMPGHEF